MVNQAYAEHFQLVDTITITFMFIYYKYNPVAVQFQMQVYENVRTVYHLWELSTVSSSWKWGRTCGCLTLICTQEINTSIAMAKRTTFQWNNIQASSKHLRYDYCDFSQINNMTQSIWIFNYICTLVELGQILPGESYWVPDTKVCTEPLIRQPLIINVLKTSKTINV